MGATIELTPSELLPADDFGLRLEDSTRLPELLLEDQRADELWQARVACRCLDCVPHSSQTSCSPDGAGHTSREHGSSPLFCMTQSELDPELDFSTFAGSFCSALGGVRDACLGHMRVFGHMCVLDHMDSLDSMLSFPRAEGCALHLRASSRLRLCNS